MLTTAYSPDFPKHWLNMPIAIRQAFYQELSDIVDMLQSGADKEFVFTYRNFDATIEALLPSDDISQNDYYTPATAPFKLSEADRQAIEQRIYDKLSLKIDDFLSEHMGQLSNNLKTWLKSTINDELSQ